MSKGNSVKLTIAFLCVLIVMCTATVFFFGLACVGALIEIDPSADPPFTAFMIFVALVCLSSICAIITAVIANVKLTKLNGLARDKTLIASLGVCAGGAAMCILLDMALCIDSLCAPDPPLIPLIFTAIASVFGVCLAITVRAIIKCAKLPPLFSHVPATPVKPVTGGKKPSDKPVDQGAYTPPPPPDKILY